MFSLFLCDVFLKGLLHLSEWLKMYIVLISLFFISTGNGPFKNLISVDSVLLRNTLEYIPQLYCHPVTLANKLEVDTKQQTMCMYVM